MQMEGLAQRIRGLARDLCPGEPLGKKGMPRAAFMKLQQIGVIQIKVNIVSLDSTYIKVHPDGMGALKKEELSQSAKLEAGGIPNFM